MGISGILDFGLDLQHAIQSKDQARALEILKNDSSINSWLPNGELPLHYAIRCRCFDVVEKMIEFSADLDIKDHQGLAAADHAILGGDKKMAALILGHKMGKCLENSRNLSNGQFSLIHQIVKLLSEEKSKNRVAAEGNVDSLEKMFQGQNLDEQDQYGMTPLHHAVVAGREGEVRWLLDHGSKLDLLTKDRKTVLHLAAIGGNVLVMNALLGNDKNSLLKPNFLDSHGCTALHYVMAAGTLTNAQLLIQHGADPTIKSFKNWKRQSVSPIDVMFGIAREHANVHDPLQLSKLQGLLFASIVASWVAQFYNFKIEFGADYTIKDVSSCLSIAVDIASVSVMLKELKSLKSKFDFWGIACLSSVFSFPVISYLSMFPGSREILQLFNHSAGTGFRVVYECWKTCLVAKVALTGLSRCWKNRFMETYRPIRNAIVYSVIGCNAGKTLVDGITNVYQDAELKETWFRETQEDGFDDLSSESKEFYREGFERNHYQQNTQSRSDEVHCEPVPSEECVLLENLNPKCKEHARVILDINDDSSCKTQFRNLTKTYHPDNKQTGRNDVYMKIREAASTLGCNR